MAVLVTGPAGRIRSHVMLALQDAGRDDVVVLDDLSTGFDRAPPRGVGRVVGDPSDAALVARVVRRHGIDALVHVAARIGVPDPVADPLGCHLATIVRTRALIEAAVRSGVRHVIVSAAAAFGEPAPVPDELLLAPIPPYGRATPASAWAIRDAVAPHRFTYAILRHGDVAGSGPRGDIALSDLAEAHRVALDHLRGGGESLTLTCGCGPGADRSRRRPPPRAARPSPRPH